VTLEPDNPENIEDIIRNLLAMATVTSALTDPAVLKDALSTNPIYIQNQIKAVLNAPANTSLTSEIWETIQFVPDLLSSLGEQVAEIADAAEGVARYITKSLKKARLTPGKRVAFDALGSLDIQLKPTFVEKFGESKFGKASSLMGSLGGVISIASIFATSAAQKPEEIAQFVVDLSSAIHDTVTSLPGLVDTLSKMSKTCRKVFDATIKPISEAAKKVGANIAARSSALMKNLGGLAAKIGSSVAKFLGPALAIVGAGFSFYQAVMDFKAGNIASGVMNVLSGTLGVVLGVLGVVNAVCGAIPGLNLAIAIISAIALVVAAIAILLSFFKPKVQNKLVARLKEKGWASRDLWEKK